MGVAVETCLNGVGMGAQLDKKVGVAAAIQQVQVGVAVGVSY